MDFKDVTKRGEHLNEVRDKLKTEFFGIDGCIDSVIDSIKTWYLMPELITRPIIVGLFGMTGTGKTALVRSLTNHLGYTSKFVEVQMDGFSQGSASDEKSISSILLNSSITEGSQGIVLLDEFQRFRTVDDMGKDIKVERYADVWMLLSDGKFPANYDALDRMERRMMFWDYWDDKHAADDAEYQARYGKSRDEEDEEKEPKKNTMRIPTYKRKYQTELQEAETLKEVLRFNESIYEIMTWPKEKTRTILREAINKKDIPPFDYSKCLVFVSGNLDDAFSMSGEVEDSDTNADIYHDYTKKINSVHIKKALMNRFKPEQIARLGNNYVIYPSLNKFAYMSIIKRSCKEYTDQATKVYGVKFNIQDSAFAEIYENAVYPTQGTRPVFTSIHKLFGSPLSDAIFWAKQNKLQEVDVSLDVPDSSLVFINQDKECRIKVDLEIRKRRDKHSDDFNALVAVHEAGHAIVYSEFFKRPPLEVAISIASFKGGYNRFTNEHLSKEETLDRISVSLGGIVAEELVFGQELRSTGCSSDIQHATSYASKFVRNYAMDGYASWITQEPSGPQTWANTDIAASNASIEQIVKDQKARAQTVLTKYRDVLIDLSRELLKVKKMDAADYEKFMKNKIEGLQSVADKDVNGDYFARLEKA